MSIIAEALRFARRLRKRIAVEERHAPAPTPSRRTRNDLVDEAWMAIVQTGPILMPF